MPKYVSRKWVNGKWQYEYDMPTSDRQRAMNGNASKGNTTQTYNKNGKLINTTHYSTKEGTGLFDRTRKTVINTSGGPSETYVTNERGKISREGEVLKNKAKSKIKNFTKNMKDDLVGASRLAAEDVKNSKAASKGREFIRKVNMKKEAKTNGVSTYNNISSDGNKKPRKVGTPYKDSKGAVRQEVSSSNNNRYSVDQLKNGRRDIAEVNRKTLKNIQNYSNARSSFSNESAGVKKERIARNKATGSKTPSQIRKDRERKAKNRAY